MLWSIVFPFQVAFCLSVGVALLVFLISRRLRSKVFGAAVTGIVAGVSFAPLWFASHVTTYPFRFGRFQAANAASVRQSQVRDFLPPGATDIEMITTTHNHHVRFQIPETELVGWMNEFWDRADEYSLFSRAESAFGDISQGPSDPDFASMGMKSSRRYKLFEGPYRGNAGGPTLWYDPESETAWQEVGYW